MTARRRVVNVGDVFGRLTITGRVDTGTVKVRCVCGAEETRETPSILYTTTSPMCDACKAEKAQAAMRRTLRRGLVGKLLAADARAALGDGPLTTSELETATRSRIGGRMHRESLRRDGVIRYLESGVEMWRVVDVLTPAQVIAESGAPSLAPGRGEKRDCVRWESCLDAYLALFPRFGESEAHCPSECGAFVPESSLRRARVDAIASARAPREVAW